MGALAFEYKRKFDDLDIDYKKKLEDSSVFKIYTKEPYIEENLSSVSLNYVDIDSEHIIIESNVTKRNMYMYELHEEIIKLKEEFKDKLIRSLFGDDTETGYKLLNYMMNELNCIKNLNNDEYFEKIEDLFYKLVNILKA